jgi:NADPH:quinone reductase-like Zn-dependent oxidoreductase
MARCPVRSFEGTAPFAAPDGRRNQLARLARDLREAQQRKHMTRRTYRRVCASPARGRSSIVRALTRVNARAILQALLTAACTASISFMVVASAQTTNPGVPPRMKAIVYREFGSPDVLRLEEIDTPVPTDDQILIRVRAASVNPLDWHFMEGTPYVARPLAFGLLEPTVTRLGVDYAGTVEAVGKNVTQFKPGDEVFGGKTGAFAEYVCVLADRAVALKPAGSTFEQAASVPVAAVTALQGLRDMGRVQPGQRVLINGASGGVGTFAVQIAKSLGADVTGVCSTKNIELVRSLGADRVIDYTKEDFAAGEQRYDVILDNVGNRSLLECIRVLKPKGKYVLIGGGGVNDGRWIGPLASPIKVLALSPFVSQDLGMLMADLNDKDLTTLGELMQTGQVKPVIDRRYKLNEVPDAIRYLEEGHARGKVVITFDPDGDASPIRANPAANSGGRPGPALIALVLIGTLLGVTIVPIGCALALNRRFRLRNSLKRSYRWGYYFSILSFIAGIGLLGVVLDSSVGAALACGLVYITLAWYFAQRRHWAWVALTILSFNPVVWIINAIYLRKRWAEDTLITPIV